MNLKEKRTVYVDKESFREENGLCCVLKEGQHFNNSEQKGSSVSLREKHLNEEERIPSFGI